MQRSEDIATINFLHNEAILEGQQEWNIPLPVSYHHKLISKILAVNYPCVVSVHSNGEIIAFGYFAPAYFDRGSTNNFCANFQCFVAQEHRRKGVAREIWEALLKHPSTAKREVYVAFLNLVSCNTEGMALAKAIGFTSDGQ